MSLPIDSDVRDLRCMASAASKSDGQAPRVGCRLTVEALLSRLADPKPNGRDRWRCACPVCGGSNRSTLSVGVGGTGAVLLKCWKSGCGPEVIAHALGLELDDLFPPRDAHSPAMKRRRLITAGQALEILELEMTLAVVCMSDMAQGKPLDEATRDRLLQGAARVVTLRDEVQV